MLTASVKTPGASSALRQAWASSAQNIESTSPASSATGMKSTGEIMPRVLCGQRASTSNADSTPVSRLMTGWKYGTMSPDGMAARNSASSDAFDFNCSSMVESKNL